MNGHLDVVSISSMVFSALVLINSIHSLLTGMNLSILLNLVPKGIISAKISPTKRLLISEIQSRTHRKKPFFCYVAYGAQHSPLQVPTEYIERYKGKFDGGWDAYRKTVFERQKELGIIPENAVLTDNDRFVEDWNSFSDSEKRVLSKYMEVYAGFMTHTDDQIGKLINYLKKIGEYDNTLIVFLTDNGASAEGSPCGTDNTLHHYYTEDFAPLISEKDSSRPWYRRCECPLSYIMAHASGTPLRMYKTWSHNGRRKGTDDSLIPQGYKRTRVGFAHNTTMSSTSIKQFLIFVAFQNQMSSKVSRRRQSTASV